VAQKAAQSELFVQFSPKKSKSCSPFDFHKRIPFFPHIERCLLEAQKEAPAGAVYVVEKHAPRYLRGLKERVYISRQGNMGTMFRKIMHRAGISPWKKLIHNLRASFAMDLMSKKFGDHNIFVIAKWLGHSVKVMIEHYGRFQQSDFAKVAEACERVEREQSQRVGGQEVHSIPFAPQNAGFAPESTASNAPMGVAQNPAQHTAVAGGIIGNDGETEQAPILLQLPQALENKVREGSNRQSVESRVNGQDSGNMGLMGGTGFEPVTSAV